MSLIQSLNEDYSLGNSLSVPLGGLPWRGRESGQCVYDSGKSGSQAYISVKEEGLVSQLTILVLFKEETRIWTHKTFFLR